jgi:hypothetical protein
VTGTVVGVAAAFARPTLARIPAPLAAAALGALAMAGSDGPLVARAARHPGQEYPRREQLRGLVQGGQHVGGGRSVAPHRDAPVPEGGGNPPTPEEEDQAALAAVSGCRKPDGSVISDG